MANKQMLFNGTSMEGWHNLDGSTPDWNVEYGIMTVGHGNILTDVTFGDCHLHLEFRCPYEPDWYGQARGNSGVYLHGCYEIQILESYGIEDYTETDCGGIYSIAKGLENACLPPLEWQSYDIFFRAPKFDDNGNVTVNGFVTVLQNGVCIHNNLELPSVTPGGCTNDQRVPRGSLMLQDHYNKVSFRNIWIKMYD